MTYFSLKQKAMTATLLNERHVQFSSPLNQQPAVGKVLSNVKWEKTHEENSIQSFRDNSDVNSPVNYNVPSTTTKIPTFFP